MKEARLEGVTLAQGHCRRGVGKPYQTPASASSITGWEGAAAARGGVRREAGPARHPYPRLGPLGTNQGPAMPMRPQNVVKMMTGRAKE